MTSTEKFRSTREAIDSLRRAGWALLTREPLPKLVINDWQGYWTAEVSPDGVVTYTQREVTK